MAAIGSTLFVAILWGAILGVAAVFLYEAYTVAEETGWLG